MILLDFSYMSCAPCVEAIPHLLELKKDFEHKNLVVLALNSNDNRESHLQRMPGFIAKHAITYPMVMTNRTVDSLYKTKVYPTFYLIDKQGKIIHSNLGFSTRAADTLRAIITRNID
jgi:thiol-disulfide isomerase/thioredoxin